jgi:hypothetical protein
MTQAEFQAALEDAQNGILTTDSGAADSVLDALEAVAISPGAFNVSKAQKAFDAS